MSSNTITLQIIKSSSTEVAELPEPNNKETPLLLLLSQKFLIWLSFQPMLQENSQMIPTPKIQSILVLFPTIFSFHIPTLPNN